MLDRILWVILLFSACNLSVFAAGRPNLNDQQITEFLAGTFVIPPESSDYGPPPSSEVFYSNGTYKFFIYKDKLCGKINRWVGVHWRVRDNILFSMLNDGRFLRDEVLNIDGDTITLRSLDDGQTYLRKKVRDCKPLPETSDAKPGLRVGAALGRAR